MNSVTDDMLQPLYQSIGDIVQTHSMSSAIQYNGLTGKIISEPVQRNNKQDQVSVSLTLTNGNKKVLWVKLSNLVTPLIGLKVHTHSLKATLYNFLMGDITGAPVERDNVMRIPVLLTLADGTTKDLLIQLGNLHLLSPKHTLPLTANEMEYFMLSAVLLGHKLQLKLCVDMGVSLIDPIYGGTSILTVALMEDNVEMIEVLANLGADVNARVDGDSSLGCCCWPTPLDLAATNGQIGVIHTLVELGADVNNVDPNGVSALLFAIRAGHVGSVQALAEHGADVNTSDSNGDTPVLVASEKNLIAVIKMLVKFGANLNLLNVFGFTPVHIACAKGHTEVITTLAELGADMNVFSLENMTPIDTAIQHNQFHVLDYLYKWGADMTPLSYYLNSNNNPVLVELVERILGKISGKCKLCGCSSKRLKKCSRCESVRYCSVACQKQDHKAHKKICCTGKC